MSIFQKKWFWASVLLLLSYFMVFHRIDVKAVHSWDESLFATRAFYMAHHGEYFTNWKDIDYGQLDHPNTKPPLITLVQALSFKTFGYNRWALRFPIAVLGLLTAALLLAFLRKISGTYVLAILGAVLLLSTPGYNHHHVLRTGDHDTAIALLLFSSLVAFLGVQFSKRPNAFLILFLSITGLAVITKSIMGMMMLPGIALYAVFFTPVFQLFKKPGLYIGLGLMVLIVFLFYGITEISHPGFLQLVWDNEVGGRYRKEIDNHVESWYFYIVYLGKKGLNPYWIFTLLGMWFGIRSQNKLIKHTTLLLTISGLAFLAVISQSDTKLLWYATPLYPIAAVLAAFGAWGAAEQWILPLLNKVTGTSLSKNWLWIGYVALLAVPSSKLIERNAKETTSYPYERYELHLEKLHEQYPELKYLKVHTNNEWYPSLVYVGNVFKKIHDLELEFITSKNEIKDGDLIFGVHHPRMNPYKMKVIERYGPKGDVKLWRVQSTGRTE